MGYYMSQTGNTSIRIKAENVPHALAAIRALAGVEAEAGGGSTSVITAEGVGNRVRHWSWVDAEYATADTFQKAMLAWRWGNIDFDEKGDVIFIGFEGEKLGDDVQLMDAIAPCVEHGSFIEMRGEDDSLWRWVFWRGGLREEYPRIVWPYEHMTAVEELLEGEGVHA